MKEYPGTVIAVTHDRYFLDNVAGWILELDRGQGIPWKGNYSSWLEQKQARLQQEEKAESKRQKTLERELEWIKQSPRARQARGEAGPPRQSAERGCLRQESMAGYEDVNDAERLSQDPTFRLIGSEKIWERGAGLTSRLQSFETEMLAEEARRRASGARP